jgi:hypothetical protein
LKCSFGAEPEAGKPGLSLRKLSRTETFGSSRLARWSSMAMSAATFTVPQKGARRPAITSSSVVLPEPFGPVIAMRSGPVTVSDTSRRTGRSAL